MSGFSVVAMVRETPDVVRRFVDYYRGLGAAEIFIYYNGPVEEAPVIREADLTVCTPEFWARFVEGPVTDSLEDRQRICYRDCYARCSSDWLLVVDADEFVFGDRPLTPLLDKLPASVESIYFPTAEAVFGPGDRIERPFGCTYFRVGWHRQQSWRLFGSMIYGPAARALNCGVMGHSIGKHMLRTGLDVTLVSGHRSKRGEKAIGIPAVKASPDFADFHLAHFDAMSQPRWEAKWRYRLDKVVVATGMTPPRRLQMQMIGKALADGTATQLFRRFYGLNGLQYRLLSALGLAFRREEFFAGSVQAETEQQTSLAA